MGDDIRSLLLLVGTSDECRQESAHEQGLLSIFHVHGFYSHLGLWPKKEVMALAPAHER